MHKAKHRQFLCVLVLCCLGVASWAWGQSPVILFDDFSGSGELDGTIPDVRPGDETWIASEVYDADGHITTSRADTGYTFQALLPFEPDQGRTYVYSVDVNPNNFTDNRDNWFAIGFINHDTKNGGEWWDTTANDDGEVGGVAWILHRIYRYGDNQIQTFLGPGTSDDGTNHRNRNEGVVTLTVILDCTQDLWTVEWYKNGRYLRGPDAYEEENPEIRYVGITKCWDAGGTIDNFELRASDDTAAFAVAPNPADEVNDVLISSVLSWKPGLTTVTRDIYIGEDFEDVSNATRSDDRGVLAATDLDVNEYDPSGSINYNKTYFWRVDETEPNGAIKKGYIWSFTVEPKALPLASVEATASSSLAGSEPENLVNGSGLDDNDYHGMTVSEMWQSDNGATGPFWVEFDFGTTYKLDEVLIWNFNASLEFLFGNGVKDMTIETSQDGSTWETLGDYEIPQGTSSVECPATPIALNGALAQYVRFNLNSSWGGTDTYGLSEVRFMYIPTWSREPDPAHGADNIVTNPTLSWRSGRDAVTHEVYVDTDESAVADGSAAMDSVSGLSHDLSDLILGTTYYWRVDAVNEAEPMQVWTGPIWDFTTVDFKVVDDFESYDDEDDLVFNTWMDGYEDDDNGSQVGHDEDPYNEERRLHRGDQAMPLYYGMDDAEDSLCTLPISDLTDWTAHGITSLVLYFRGELDNEAGQLYAKINNARVDYDRSAEDLNKDMYIQWTIDLSEVSTNLNSVTEFSLGLEDSGEGLLYIDDIRLYREAPPVYTSEMWIEAEDATQLIPGMDVNDVVAGASGGLYVEVDDDNSGNMPPIDNMNTEDDESDDLVEAASTFTLWLEPGVYQVNAKVLGNSGSNNSFWVRFLGPTTDPNNYWTDDNEGSTHYEELTDWIEWEFEVSEDWIVAPITSITNEDAIVQFTVETADYYNLEIALREDNALLDAIMITQTLD